MVFRSRRSAICNLPIMSVCGGRHLNVLDLPSQHWAARCGGKTPNDWRVPTGVHLSGQPSTRRGLRAACDPKSVFEHELCAARRLARGKILLRGTWRNQLCGRPSCSSPFGVIHQLWSGLLTQRVFEGNGCVDSDGKVVETVSLLFKAQW